MRLEDLLPIGSVVLLKNARQKLMIIGLVQAKPMADGSTKLFDYLGVPFPSGFMGSETALLFNHEQIEEITFMGYVNKEREAFVALMQNLMDSTQKKEEE